ncbi:MAG: DUF3786 domain-containing protein [Bacillota bacterium]
MPAPGYQEALRVARALLSQKDPQEVAAFTGASWKTGASRFVLAFLGKQYDITYPGGEVWHGQSPVPDTDAILVLHYLTHATGAVLRQELIAFRQLPGGEIYLDPFRKRTIALLMRFFGGDPGRLVRAALALGGSHDGQYRVTVDALPRVPVTLVLWPGDDEVSADGNVLYNASAPLYLPTEDLIVLATSTILALNQAA